MYIYIYIYYLYLHREREREREQSSCYFASFRRDEHIDPSTGIVSGMYKDREFYSSKPNGCKLRCCVRLPAVMCFRALTVHTVWAF